MMDRNNGQIFVITDGQVSGTVTILRRVRGCGIQLFCLGIGSASQDRFLELLARQTGGVGRFATLSEDVETSAAELFGALKGTVASNVRIAGAVVLTPSSGLVFSGIPIVASGQIDAETSAVSIESSQGAMQIPLQVLSEDLTGLLEKLEGARLIADMESRCERWDDKARQQILEVSQRYGLASSEMSLVAVVNREDDQAVDLPKTKIIPVGMPRFTRFDAYFRTRMDGADGAAYVMSMPDAQYGRVFAAMPLRERRTSLKLVHALHEAIKLVESDSAVVAGADASLCLTRLLNVFVPAQPKLQNELQKTSLTALIDFLSADMIDYLSSSKLDLAKWQKLKRQLELAWPDLLSTTAQSADAAATPVHSGTLKSVRLAISRYFSLKRS